MRAVVERVGRLRQLQLPDRVDAHALERQQQPALGLELEQAGGVGGRGERDRLGSPAQRDGVERAAGDDGARTPRRPTASPARPRTGGSSATSETRTRLISRR